MPTETYEVVGTIDARSLRPGHLIRTRDRHIVQVRGADVVEIEGLTENVHLNIEHPYKGWISYTVPTGPIDLWTKTARGTVLGRRARPVSKRVLEWAESLEKCLDCGGTGRTPEGDFCWCEDGSSAEVIWKFSPGKVGGRGASQSSWDPIHKGTRKRRKTR